MKRFLILAPLLIAATNSQAGSCPALEGVYSSCVTVYQGQSSPSGAVTIRRTQDSAGVTHYSFEITGVGGPEGTLELTADGQPRRGVSGPDHGVITSTVTSTSCTADGKSLVSQDAVSVAIPSDPHDVPAKYTLKATYSKDSHGALRVSNEWEFAAGPMSQIVTCTP